ncbi:MAG: response regulator [Sandaracinaceae bacterium]|nr:response regulator [Sandaracinaceae bacterium]
MTESLSRVRILIVDDDTVDRRAAVRATRALPFSVDCVECADGEEAIQILEKEPFSVVLLDHTLPGMTGAQVMEQLRGRGLRVPVVYLTGASDPEIVADAMRAGATDYLSKAALTPERLARTIRYSLHVSDAERQIEIARGELTRYAAQLQRLVDGTLRIHSATTIDDVVNALGETSQTVLGGRAFVALEILGKRHSFGAWPTEPTEDSDRDLRIDLPFAHRPDQFSGSLRVVRESADFVGAEHLVVVQLARTAVLAMENIVLLEDARLSARARQEIVTVVSHDLRTPLNAFSLGLEILERKSAGEEQPVLPRLRRNIASMENLIRDILDVTRIQDAKLALRVSIADVREIVRDVSEELSPVAEKNGLRIEVELPADALRASCDRARMHQALVNLGSNAVKFTSSGGRITLRAMHLDGHARFEVEDTGGGVSQESLPFLFERLFQDPAHTDRGAGLGLYITKGIVESHGGTVGVESVKGCGAKFWINLPLNHHPRTTIDLD